MMKLIIILKKIYKKMKKKGRVKAYFNKIIKLLKLNKLFKLKQKLNLKNSEVCQLENFKDTNREFLIF